MAHETALKILESIRDNVANYQASHIDAVYPHLNALYRDKYSFKSIHELDSKDVWGLLFERAKVVGCRANTMAGIYYNKLESDFKYMYSHINWYTTSQSVSGIRPTLTTEPQRFALTHGLIAYIKKDIDYRLIPDQMVADLFQDLERRYYTEVYKDDFNKNSKGDA